MATQREIIARIDERVLHISKDWDEMKPLIQSIPKLKERINWLRLGLLSMGGLLVFVQVVVALWK